MTRKCTKCKKELPATLEYFHKSGLTCYCKGCCRLMSHAHYLKRKERLKKLRAAGLPTNPYEKVCTRCGSIKPANLIYFAADKRNTTTGLHSWCRSCQTDYCRSGRSRPLSDYAAESLPQPFKPHTTPEGIPVY